ncbi:hypothetical protein CK203_083596 [Vitis vinifera]|uniref:Reverse transcriptase/retrotransposon-derived protein RNase H-like domain-containing protein n=1 Tax=Vitis vinifera TaxID=29760 RepID=A0A438BS79_VITVI|nr:hypothetical protein CK203_083596 [Vitis vinifera]
MEHLTKVFMVLMHNELNKKKEKCSFSKEEVISLRHHIKDDKLMMDDSKVNAMCTPDASEFAIRGVLIQNRHLIAFMSCKLYDTKMWYMVQEKKMTSIIHCLRT